MRAAPAVSCAKLCEETHTSIQVQREQSGIPCAMALRLMPRSPRRRIPLVTVIDGLAALSRPVGLTKTSADLTPATGARTTRFCRTQPPAPKASTGLVPVRRSFSEGGFSAVRLARCRPLTGLNPPCDPIARPTLPRPPHPIPTFVTMANAPREERDGGISSPDLGPAKTGIFSRRGWTGQITLNRLNKFARPDSQILPISARNRRRMGARGCRQERLSGPVDRGDRCRLFGKADITLRCQCGLQPDPDGHWFALHFGFRAWFHGSNV
jgi:hypothetical protein